MGIEAMRNHDLISKAPDYNEQVMPLSPSSRGELWEELVNLRLQQDGPYVFFKPRGGNVHVQSFDGNIIASKQFTATTSGAQKSYIAVQTDNGSAYLYNYTDKTAPVTMIDSALSSDEPATMIVIGIFVYIFDFDQNVFKVYDIERGVANDWMDAPLGSVREWEWNEDGRWDTDNIWGIEEGSRILVLHNFEDGAYFDSQRQARSLRSFTSRVDRALEDSVIYEDPAGNARSTNDSAAIALCGMNPDLDDFVGRTSLFQFSSQAPSGSFQVLTTPGSTSEFFHLMVGRNRVPDQGEIEALSNDDRDEVAEKIEDALLTSAGVMSRYNVSRNGRFVTLESRIKGPEAFNDEFEFIRITEGAEVFVSATAPYFTGNIEPNDEYVEPVLWRGYLVVDLLEDGSYVNHGRPALVRTPISDVIGSARTSVKLTLNPPPDRVRQRLLFATRWQVSSENVFNPSRPEYDNGAFFFAKQVDPAQLVVDDKTPDNKLQSPLSAYISLTGGIVQQFAARQITPSSAARADNFLLFGGYRIDRPVPKVYTDADNSHDRNVFVSVADGDNLTENPTVHILFEYTDGMKSNPVDSEVILTDAEEVMESGVVAKKAFTDFQWPNISSDGPGHDGSITTTLLSDSGNPVETTYLETDNWDTIFSSVISDINGSALPLEAEDIGQQAGDMGTIRISWDTAGIQGNDELVSQIQMTDTDEIVDGQTKSLSGGIDGADPQTRSANYLQLHSLNALVSKAYILIKKGSDVYLYDDILASSAGFYGDIIRLPNTDEQIDELTDFDMPPANQIRESQDLQNYIVAGVPPQQIYIDEQRSIKDDSSIQAIIPTQFDVDKTEMRLRLVVFTDRNMQIGYLITSARSVSSDFEIIGQGPTVRHRSTAFRVETALVFQATDGIYMYRQNSASKVLDARRYNLLAKRLTGVSYSRQWGEFWLFFDDKQVLILSPGDESEKTFEMHQPSTGAVMSGDEMLIAIKDGLYRGDVASQDDPTGPITAIATTRHLGTSDSQLRILEVSIEGRDLDATVMIDLQRGRMEEGPADWSREFNSDVTSDKKPLKMHGTPFVFTHRAVMPKLRAVFEGNSGGFAGEMKIHHITTENKGVARK